MYYFLFIGWNTAHQLKSQLLCSFHFAPLSSISPLNYLSSVYTVFISVRIYLDMSLSLGRATTTLNIDSFQGDHNNIHDWLREYDEQATRALWSENQRYHNLYLYLGGEPKKWYKRNSRSHPYFPRNWTILKRELVAVFT